MATLGNFTSGQVLTAAELNAIAAPVSFTPTWTGITVGNGTNTGVYFRIQDLIFMQVELVFGSTTSMGSSPDLDYPVAATSSNNNNFGGTVLLEDASSTDYIGIVYPFSTTKMAIERLSVISSDITRGNINATTPFTWTTGDRIIVNHWYRAA